MAFLVDVISILLCTRSRPDSAQQRCAVYPWPGSSVHTATCARTDTPDGAIVHSARFARTVDGSLLAVVMSVLREPDACGLLSDNHAIGREAAPCMAAAKSPWRWQR